MNLPGVTTGINRAAVFSDDRVYRYSLFRSWGESTYRCCFILLNPSTADAEHDDPTNRRGMTFAHRWGCGAVEFVNLFALRSVDPRRLVTHPDPVGPGNDGYILAAVQVANLVVVAWGTQGTLYARDRSVLKLLPGVDLLCLGVNQEGSPKHPLYVPEATPLMRFQSEGV